MASLVLAGATSGSTTLTPTDAVTATITLPSATGTLATLGANAFTGIATNSAQPAFNAIAPLQNTVTGDGTNYSVTFTTKIFDKGTNYSTGTSKFTAPVTGTYNFGSSLLFNGIDVSMTRAILYLQTTARTVELADVNPQGIKIATTFVMLSGSMILPMTAGDTALIYVSISGSGLSAGVTTQSYFWGNLLS
jgi:hypothetical protein